MRKHFHAIIASLMAIGLAVPAGSFAAGPQKGVPSGNVNQTVSEARTEFIPILEKTRSSQRFTGPLTHAHLQMQPAMAPQFTSSDMPVLYANVIYSGLETFQTKAMYKIPTAQGQAFEYVGGEGINASGGGIEVGDRYMAHTVLTASGSILGQYVRKYDTTFWDQKAANSSVKVGVIATDLALDPTDNTVYGCFYNDDVTGYVFGKMNYSSYKRTAIAPLQKGWNACAFDALGQLYAIDQTGMLVKVDKATGEVTNVGSTGITPKYTSSACIDPVSGRMFWAASPADETGKLFEIDLTTGAATLLCQFPGNEQVVGLYIPTPLAEDKAPASVDNLKADFPQGALTGHITFDAPTTSFDGEETSGELSYTILNKTTKIAEGTTSCGAHVSEEVTIAKSGNCEFIVTVANSVGSSPKSRVKMFVGPDKPVAPEVSATYADGKFTVSWNAVTESVNGGYMNADAVTYKVVRFPDKTVIADATAATSIEDEVAPSDTEYVVYYYTVTATADGITSDAGQSNKIGLGQAVPPYSETFDTEASLNSFTIIDANKDEKTWSFNSNNKRARARENSQINMDDWLITPPLKLEKDKIYKFSMDVTTAKTYTECFEARYGNGNTVADMTETLFEIQEINAGDGRHFVGYVKAKADGLYYIGIHGLSKKNQFYLDVDNLSLEEGTTALIPDAPTALTVSPDKDGALKATITFNAPAIDLLGGTLSALDKVEILRDGTVIDTKENPAVGASISFEDTGAASGKHIYTAVGYNEHGRGWEAIDSAFVGINVPAAATDIVAKETANVGEVTITWEAPAIDIDEFAINPALITYDVVSVQGENLTVVAENLTATTFTYRAVEADVPQQFYYYQVNAKTSAGFTPAVSASIPVGKADAAPYFESFADGSAAHAIDGAPVIGNTTWSLYTDTNDLGVTAADGDNGFAASAGEYGNDTAALFTGKIDLTGINKPVLTFFAYNIPNSDGSLNDRNKLEVLVTCDGKEKSIKEFTMQELGPAGWNKALVNLSKYAGKTVQVKWVSKLASFKYTLIDNIRLVEYLDYDLAVNAIEVPKKVMINTDFTVNVALENAGSKKVKDYTVELYRDDELVATQPGIELAPEETAILPLTTQVSAVSAENVEFHAVVKLASDMDESNNTSEKASTAVKWPKYPAASNLSASLNEQNAVELAWDEPEMESAPASMTEGFENEEAFLVNDVDDWTFIDNDGGKTYGISDVTFPGSGSEMAFIVLDDSYSEFADVEGLNAQSGTKMLASFCSKKGQNDDWAISPRLYGTAQKVSFYAKSFGDDYPESFEFLYSTTGTAIENFTSVAKVEEVPAEWTKYEYDIPEGSRYFAIRCTSKDKFIFMLDEVTFVPAAPGDGLSIMGYNVYRNGEKINESIVDEPSYVDATAEDGAHSYVVTVVYDKGESAPSNSANITTSAIDNVMTAGPKVSVIGQSIVITEAEGLPVSIVTVDGKTLYRAVAGDIVKYDAVQGIYVVTVGDRAEKVMVK